MQVYRTEAVRNVALLSHSGAGTTSLSEALLLTAGAITRLGQVTDGNTVSDYEPEEIERRSSMQMAVIPCEWQGKKLNFLDTPGYADFVGEVLSALAAADSAVIVVSAVDGVQVGTESAWRLAGAVVPILATSATQAMGAKELLDFVAAHIPSPSERPPVKASLPSGGTMEIKPADSAPWPSASSRPPPTPMLASSRTSGSWGPASRARRSSGTPIRVSRSASPRSLCPGARCRIASPPWRRAILAPWASYSTPAPSTPFR